MEQRNPSNQSSVPVREQGSGEQPSRQQGVGKRSRLDPWGMSIMPGEFLSTNPFSMMRRMQDEMDRVLASTFGGGGNRGMRSWSPAIEVAERDGNYVVCAELPGLKAENVSVEVTNDALVIEGERKQESEENQGGVHRTERSYGHFYRAVPLPESASGEQAQANFRDGVLEVKIPMKAQPPQRRKIPIQGGQQQNQTASNNPGSNTSTGSPSDAGGNQPASQPGSGQGNAELREGKLPGGGH